jgi:hypothetical protein
LVDSGDDILGIIAYSIYKRQKIEYIETIKSQYKRIPTRQEMYAFRNVANSSTQLDGYKNQAFVFARSFLDEALAAEAEKIQNHYSAKAEQEIKNMKPNFWFGVWQSVVGSVFFVLVLGLLVFFTWSLNQGPKQVIENIFKVRILSADEAGAPLSRPDAP